MHKKRYRNPEISLLPTKCHISTLTEKEPEDCNRSRRNLLIKGGLIATVGQLTPLYASDDNGPGATTTKSDEGPKVW
jgi:hypothetical protein